MLSKSKTTSLEHRWKTLLLQVQFVTNRCHSWIHLSFELFEFSSIYFMNKCIAEMNANEISTVLEGRAICQEDSNATSVQRTWIDEYRFISLCTIFIFEYFQLRETCKNNEEKPGITIIILKITNSSYEYIQHMYTSTQISNKFLQVEYYRQFAHIHLGLFISNSTIPFNSTSRKCFI